MKIIGNTVGMGLPKPNLKQNDPTKGDYIKGKDIIPTKLSQLENDARYSSESYVDNKIAAIPTPDVSGQINEHNVATDSHNDIRLLVDGLTARLNALANSDDTTLDQMSEIVAYIKNNKSLIDSITTSKVNVNDIIDNLITNVSDKPLSAAQGVALKGLIDAINTSLSSYAKTSAIPTKVSQLSNDSKYLTSYTETDPTVPAWAKAPNKPTYTASEVGADKSGSATQALTEAKEYTDVKYNELDEKKVDKVNGKGLSTNDYTTAEKNKLTGIAENANNYSLPTASSSTLGGVKVGSNIDVSGGVISVPTADKDKAGVTIVYPAASCTTFSSDAGTVTPLAVQKGAKQFAITRPTSSTDKAITRYSNATGDVQDSKIIIEDVTNTRDSSKKAQVIAIPAEGNKKMVYGYCTDQVDGTSFIGGVFDKSATSYPYSEGLAIGGTSGNLLWKGKKVAVADDIPSDSTITSKINTALEAAKVSGEFDGAPGAPGASITVKSVTESTADGGSNVVTFSDGKTVTIKNGHKGSKGDPGATPIKGTDYWTPDEQEAISEEVNALVATELAKRGQLKPEFANSVAECTDTSKLYVLPDGYIYAYMSSTGALFTDVIATSIDTDGKIYNGGLGYRKGITLNTTGGNYDLENGVATGFIPIKNLNDFVIEVSGKVGSLTNMDTMKFYNSSFAYIKVDNIDRMDTQVSKYGATFEAEPAFGNSVNTFKFSFQSFKSKSSYYAGLLSSGGAAYVRFGFNGYDLSKFVAAVNEEIAYGTSSKWVSTGHQFVPADCEGRIVPLENTAQNHESRISNLETHGSGSSSTSADIPAYIKEEADKVLNRLMEKQGNRVFNMVAMSDFHYTGYSSKYPGTVDNNRETLLSVAKATSYMLDRVHIDAVATLGDNTPFGAVTANDIAWGHKWHREINEILSMTQRQGVVDFRTVGNHDRMGANDSDGNPTPIMPDGAIYQYIQGYNRQCDYLSAPVGYGYKDFEGYKLRVIVLNSAECEGKGRFDEPHYGYFIGNDQYNWLVEKALDLRSKPDATAWQILILSHHRADDVQLATDGHFYGQNAYILPNILNAYKTGGSYSGIIADEGISVSCNFAGKNQARLIGQIHGHHHGYQYYNLYLGSTDNSTQTNIMAVGTPTTGFGTTNPDNDGNTYTSSELGTAGETTFCVYAIDLDEHKIYSINYGKGIDREISY